MNRRAEDGKRGVRFSRLRCPAPCLLIAPPYEAVATAGSRASSTRAGGACARPRQDLAGGL